MVYASWGRPGKLAGREMILCKSLRQNGKGVATQAEAVRVCPSPLARVG